MKKLYVVFTVLLFCVLCPVPAQVQAETAVMAKTQIYQQMSDNLMKRKKEFTIPCARTALVDSIVRRMNCGDEESYFSVFFDMAQEIDDKKTTDDGGYLFGLIDQASCYYDREGLHFYAVTYFETLAQTRKVNVRAKKLAKAIMRKKSTKYGRILLAYATVTDLVKYDGRKKFLSSAYGGFYKNKTVCNGYALMMYKLLMYMDIPCEFVSGKIRNGKRWQLHAWNLVKYGGKWYELDACSDDGDDDYIYTDYFLKCRKTMKKTHKPDFGYRKKAFQKKYKMGTRDIDVG